MRAWIESRGARSEATRRAYRREAERLLLWAIVAKDKPLSSLNTLDAAQYLKRFLADPQPTQRWIGRGRVGRFDPAPVRRPAVRAQPRHRAARPNRRGRLARALGAAQDRPNAAR
ncbi:hypothetical protein ACS0Y7_37025, partial [Burkholderia gladioli]